MSFRVKIVFHIARFGGENSVVPSHIAILAGKPFRASLAEDNVSRNDVLLTGFFGSETSTGRIAGAAICTALGSVGGVADMG